MEGLYEKLSLDGLCEFIQTFDILGLGETFTLPGFDFNIKFPDFFALHCPATKYSKMGRPSGGLVLLIRKSLAQHIEIVETHISHIFAIKISKKLLNTTKDLLFITMYNHPKESVFYKRKDYYSTLEQLEYFLANNIEKGKDYDLLISGDLNARIGEWEYQEEQESDDEDQQVTYERASQDQQINEIGKTLIELCVSFCLTPLAGLKEKKIHFSLYFYWTQRKQYY